MLFFAYFDNFITVNVANIIILFTVTMAINKLQNRSGNYLVEMVKRFRSLQHVNPTGTRR